MALKNLKSILIACDMQTSWAVKHLFLSVAIGLISKSHAEKKVQNL